MKGIMEESLIVRELNGIPQAPLLCTGQEEEALLTGHLVTAGLAASPAQIRHVTRWENIWQVSLTEPAGAADLLVRLQALTPNRSDRTISMQALNQLCDQVMSLDHSTGLHAILLSEGDQTVIGRNVGRHNALDKAVGKALKKVYASPGPRCVPPGSFPWKCSQKPRWRGSLFS